MFGFWAGGAFCFWTFARASPPGWIENWQTGALGEQATAKRLALLEHEGWIVLHDLRHGERNVDHVVVGPGGVFLLDTKRLDGVVTVDGSTVIVRRIDDPDLEYRHTGASHVVRLAQETHDRVLAVSRIRTWVTPVMVLWADFPQKVVPGRCTCVSGDELVDWLRSQPPRVAPERVPQLAAAVRAGWSHPAPAL
jgi:hypothetical protein